MINLIPSTDFLTKRITYLDGEIARLKKELETAEAERTSHTTLIEIAKGYEHINTKSNS